MAPDESVILPLASVKFPIVDPVAAETVDEKVPVPVTLRLPDANVPVVLKFSSPNVIAPDESVILPFANVKFPMVDPVAAETVDEKVPVPVTLKLPDASADVLKFSSPKDILPPRLLYFHWLVLNLLWLIQLLLKQLMKRFQCLLHLNYQMLMFQ